MTKATFQRPLGILLVVAGALIAAGSAALGTRTTLAAVALAVLAIVAVYAVRHPSVMLVTMVVVEATNISAVTGLSLMSPMVGLGVLTVGYALRERATRSILDRWTALGIFLIGFYFITQVLALLGSQAMDASMTRMIESVLDFTFLVVLFFLVRITGRPWLAAQAFVAALAVLSLLSMANEFVFGGTQSFGGFANVTQATAELITTQRYAGPLADSNFWGRHLILGLPLAGALVVRAVNARQRIATALWIAAALAIVGGVYLTQSRGTMLATAVVIIVWVLASGPAARRIGLMGLPFVALLLAAPGVGNRFINLISDVFTPGYKYGVDPSVLGRTAAQEMTWEMFFDWPLFGVGPSAFATLLPFYTDRVPTAVLQPANAPHNLYAQLAGESGIIGFLGWIVFLGTLVVLLARRISRISPSSAAADRSLAAGVLGAIIGWSFASIFLHMSYFRTFAIILALAWALCCVRESQSSWTPQVNPEQLRRLVVSSVVALTSAAALLAVTATPTHVATARGTLLPSEQVTAQYSYALDLRSREAIMPTYAAVVGSRAPDATVIPNVVRGIITISVEDATMDSARTDLEIAWANAHTNLSLLGLDHTYTLSQVGPVQFETQLRHSPISVIAALLAAAATGVLTMLILLRHSARQPRVAAPFRAHRNLGRRQNDDLLKRP